MLLDLSSLRPARVLVAVAILCLLTQIGGALLQEDEDVRSPNQSTSLAWNLLQHGTYESPGAARIWGDQSPHRDVALKAFHLPGEPLYLALALKVLPASLRTWAHVPVTVWLVLAFTWAAMLMGGTELGLIVGLLACFHPFLVSHGRVYDDGFLSTAMEWTVLGILLARLTGKSWPATAIGTWVSVAVAALLAGYAAITRAQSMPILAGVAVVALTVPKLRSLRWHGAGMLVMIAATTLVWGFRNQQALGHFMIGSTHDGITLWESNYAHAAEAMWRHGVVEDLNEQYMQEDFARTQSLDEYAANQFFIRRAKTYMLAHPGPVLWTALNKLAISLTGYKAPLPPNAPRNIIALTLHPLLLVTGIAGLVLLRRRITGQPKAVLWWSAMMLMFAVVFAILIIGPNSYRYRITWDGFLLMGAAVLIERFAFLDGADGPGTRPGGRTPQQGKSAASEP